MTMADPKSYSHEITMTITVTVSNALSFEERARIYNSIKLFALHEVEKANYRASGIGVKEIEFNYMPCPEND